MRLLFDIETDGLLDSVTKVHCLVASDIDTGDEYYWEQRDIVTGIRFLQTAKMLSGPVSYTHLTLPTNREV